MSQGWGWNSEAGGLLKMYDVFNSENHKLRRKRGRWVVPGALRSPGLPPAYFLGRAALGCLQLESG